MTGGLGYIGGRVSQALASAGWKVRIASRRAASKIPDWAKGFDFIQIIDADRQTLMEACQDCALIVHLAAMNEVDAAKYPEEALRVNGMESLAWLLAAQTMRAKRFIFFSTAHVYAAPLIGSLKETSLPVPRHPYAITHRTAEDFVLAAHAAGQIDGLVLRLSNAVGAPADIDVNRWMLVTNDLCRQAVTENTLTLKSSGLQLRDFIAMQDITGAVQHFAEAHRAVWDDGLFNLGSGIAMSVYDMAGLIADRARMILSRDVSIERVAPKKGEISESLDFRVDKLRAAGFSPANDLAREIDAMLLLCRSAFGK
ncbi:MAG: SDR family oxidoreductase [Pseudomonadota bacterium]